MGVLVIPRNSRVDIGLYGSWPGNNQPPFSIKLWACPYWYQSRKQSNNIGDSFAKRSFWPLPCSTFNTIRSLSISETFKATALLIRNPAPYATDNAARYFGLWQSLISRLTSSMLSTLGSLRGEGTEHNHFAMYGWSRVLQYKAR
jgi:hypothetical protein